MQDLFQKCVSDVWEIDKIMAYTIIIIIIIIIITIITTVIIFIIITITIIIIVTFFTVCWKKRNVFLEHR